MLNLKFDSRFAPLVKSGEKVRSIRKDKSAQFGEAINLIDLYDNSLAQMAKCVGCHPIRFYKKRILFGNYIASHSYWQQLAKSVGFSHTSEMIDYYDNLYGIPFRGNVIEWQVLID